MTMNRTIGLLLSTALMALGLAACGSYGTSGGSGAGPTAPAPEEVIAPDAEVTAGLKRLAATAAQIAADPGSDAAKAAVTQLEPAWMPVEGTVLKNAKDEYLLIEEALGLLEKGAEGDAAKAARGAKTMAEAVTAYLKKFPGS